MTTLSAEQKAELAEHGVTVIRRLVDAETCRHARQMVDEICGPPRQQIEVAALDLSRSYKDGASKGAAGFVYASSKKGVVNRLGTTAKQSQAEFEDEEVWVRSGLQLTTAGRTRARRRRTSPPGTTRTQSFTRSTIQRRPQSSRRWCRSSSTCFLRCTSPADLKLLNQNFRR
jgi:hypothetical protein